MNHSTIVESLRVNAIEMPEALAFRYLDDNGESIGELSFSQLWHDSSKVANYLLGIAEPKSCILLFFPPGLEYVKAFYGCLIAGMIAVPLYPPRRNAKSNRINKVIDSCGARVALTTPNEYKNIESVLDLENLSQQKIEVVSFELTQVETLLCGKREAVKSQDVAFLQYTSGSTGAPKGVTITHGNIVANLKHLSLMSGGSTNDVFVNWLPLFHDLGLITAILWPVYLGAPSTLMAPATFVRDPSIWLKAIDKYKGTMCGAPNFAYDLCVAKIKNEALVSLDISSWRVAYNAAEPVRAKTLIEFSEKFATAGFSKTAFYPGYGMAEATVFITGGDPENIARIIRVNKDAITRNKVEVESTDCDSSLQIVGCGTALYPHDVKIVDPETSKVLPEGDIGEIWFSGPSVSPGYWGMEELNRITFNQNYIGSEATEGGYLRTGDLGVILNGELFVTGRIKDLIILSGKNYYPQDIENSVAESHEAIHEGHVAAFSVVEGGVEKLVVVAELERQHFKQVNYSFLMQKVREIVFQHHGVTVDQLVFLKPYKIPMTSSGKIQRRQTKEMLINGELEILANSSLEAGRQYEAPTSDIEFALCGIWASVLELDRVGITENFFDLGGNSIAAIVISNKVKTHFVEVDLDPVHLLEFPTVAEMAQWIGLSLSHAQQMRQGMIRNHAEAICI